MFGVADVFSYQDVNLPIVFLGKFIGWLPLEFAYQSLAKTKDANESDMVR